MLVTAPIVALLCGGLRFFGFKLRQALPAQNLHGPQGKGPTYQFGMKHMLIWLTASGPLLLFVRSLDINGDSIFPVALVAMSVATVNLTSIWVVLGGGHWIIRVVAILGLPFLISIGMSYYSAHVKATAGRPLWQSYGTIPWAIGEMEDLWMVWLWLDAALLAALLLFLRAIGYRLMRTSRPPLVDERT